MNNKELSKEMYCVVMRNGIRVWIEKERVENFKKILETLSEHKFIRFDDKVMNTADISGIFSPQDMEEMTRRKNGQWNCRFGYWHDRNAKCECAFIQNNLYLCSKCRKKATGYVGTGKDRVCMECYEKS